MLYDFKIYYVLLTDINKNKKGKHLYYYIIKCRLINIDKNIYLIIIYNYN